MWCLERHPEQLPNPLGLTGWCFASLHPIPALRMTSVRLQGEMWGMPSNGPETHTNTHQAHTGRE